MKTADALDMIEALVRAAAHPDVVAVRRYGSDPEPGGNWPSGVKLVHETGAESMLWAAVPPRDARPVALPQEMPEPRLRATRLLIFAHRLLDVAQPSRLASWELCAAPGVGIAPGESPSALRLHCRDRSVVYLRATAASGTSGEPDTDPYPDYQIPEGVRTCLTDPSARSAALTSA